MFRQACDPKVPIRTFRAAFWPLITVSLVIVGCGPKEAPIVSPPDSGDTIGLILVDSPEVFARERLVRDREQQKHWLKQQLTLSDAHFEAFQAAVDSRSVRSTSRSLTIDATPSAGLAVRQTAAATSDLTRRQEVADLEHRIRVAQLEAQLEQAEAGELPSTVMLSESQDGGSSGEGETGSESEDASEAPADAPGDAPPAQEASNPFASLPSGRDGSPTIRDTPQDFYRAKRAYRELVRQDLLENDLDDAHDLLGNTLYRLTFDTTIFPGKNAGNWAVVNIAIDDDAFECDLEDKSKRLDMIYFFEEFQAHLQRFVTNEVRGLTEAFFQADLRTVDPHVARLVYSGDPARKYPEEMQKMEEELDVAEVELLRYETELKNSKNEKERREVLAALSETKTQVNEIIPQKIKDFRDKAAEKAATVVSAEFTDLSKMRGLKDYLDFWKIKNKGDVRAKIREKENLQVKELDDKDIDVGVALANFCGLLGKLRSRVDTYAVTPKESVERISDFGAARSSDEWVIAAGLSAGTVDLEGGLRYLQAAEAQRQAIRRRPLIVGFSQAQPVVGSETKCKAELRSCQETKVTCRKNLEQCEASLANKHGRKVLEATRIPLDSDLKRFGWIIGPRFTPRYKDLGFDYRQTTTQVPLSAVVSIPAWWTDANIDISTCWVGEKGLAGSETCSNLGQTVKVRLPGDPLELLGALFPRTRRPKPLFYHEPDIEIGRPEQLVIFGENLWRNPVVAIGSQRAASVEILPDMKGIVATFSSLLQPAGWTADQQFSPEDVWVWTSEGDGYAGIARVHKPQKPPKKNAPKPHFKVSSRVDFISADKDDKGVVAVKFEFDTKKEKDKEVQLAGKVTMEIQNAFVGTPPTTGSCLSVTNGTWVVTGPCQFEVPLERLKPKQVVTISAYRMEGATKVKHDPISLEVR